ncbi:MAG: AAA family ATPase [Proteobacteria bacterium]|nr:AAA family ATPase [Pseudomonadota bacterium]MBU1420522.1 AAA family ATPase [Pseudomonadota bacterium]MBU1456085.1 AAA family ATPase [Pseudomonadota bacterium]
MRQGVVTETIQGIVERVTFHNEANGWSVLRVKCFNEFEPVTVIVHQTKVFAGATMKFFGSWANHPKFGRQFSADRAEERKPASAAALEKYLGSGLIKGVGPKTARRIVSHFGDQTLPVFEGRISELLKVPGIAEKKLEGIREAWEEHKAIRDVMLFLQGHGISTLFAVRIFKKYGEQAIALVTENPYRLANDFYGIGFFSADKVALSLGIEKNAPIRIFAAIRHILAASREQGHCYLTIDQIHGGVKQLLDLDLTGLLETYLQLMEQERHLKRRLLVQKDHSQLPCYYSKSLYFDEKDTAEALHALCRPIAVDEGRVSKWLDDYGRTQHITLSPEQESAVRGIVSCGCSILTGGPGCGKTTTTKTLVKLFLTMDKEVLLAAPTGRAAQRMEEVIGLEAKTIHRLLEFQSGSFKRNKENPLPGDVLVLDECSMLDISLSAALLSAMPVGGQLVLVGDADQLPSVGAGNVLGDLLTSRVVPSFTLKTVFRQAQESHIISYAHDINNGKIPKIPSPFKSPALWQEQRDCLFIDSNEATQEQLRVIARAKEQLQLTEREAEFGEERLFSQEETAQAEKMSSPTVAPGKYDHINFGLLQTAENKADELRAVLKQVHPWSSLYYGLTAEQVILRLYTEWIPKYFGVSCEIQVLSPMNRASLGTVKLNESLQTAVNPANNDKAQVSLGERIFRVGDRVIHRKNNYDLGVYNGDIGEIIAINSIELTCVVRFFSDKREVEYQRDQISELELAYAISIHKSQGSEFDCVIIPLVSQHYKMLFRNLIYTGLTRAKKLAVFVGTRQALTMAIRNMDTATRQTALPLLLQELQQNTL